MFQLQPEPTFKATISIPTVNGAGEITFILKYRSRSALTAFYENVQDEDGKNKTDNALINEIVLGWEGVDTPFTKKALDALLDNYAGAAMAILNGYTKALVEGQQKN